MTDIEGAGAKDLRGTRSLLAVAGLFAVNGLLIGGIGGTLPAMRQRLGVDAGGLAVLLVSLAVAAVVSMQMGGATGRQSWREERGTAGLCPADRGRRGLGLRPDLAACRLRHGVGGAW